MNKIYGASIVVVSIVVSRSVGYLLWGKNTSGSYLKEIRHADIEGTGEDRGAVDVLPDVSKNTATLMQPCNLSWPAQNASWAYLVRYTQSGYIPDLLQVPMWSRVVFINCSSGGMRTASDPHPVHTDYGVFDSRIDTATGATWSFDFTTRGTFSYHNHMKSLHRW
jgi:hypothetical protein